MMPNSWKYKLILLVVLTAASIYLILPSVLGMGEMREEAAATGAPLPWYCSVLPDKGINLGLDLRGGIYLEFEVQSGKAIANKVDLIIADLERWLKKQEIPFSSINQDPKDHSVLIAGLSEAGAARLRGYVGDSYSDILAWKTRGDAAAGTVNFSLQENYTKHLEGQIIKQALEKVRNRIDRYGVAEPSIHRLGSDRIAIELPGIKDPERAIGLIKKAGQLEFKMVDDSVPEPKLAEMVAGARAAENLPDDFSIATVERINDSLRGALPEGTEIAFEIQYDPVQKKTTGGVPYLIRRRAEVTGEMLKNAQVNVHDNEPYVSLTFDAQGTALFGETTTQNVGKRMAIMLDGNVTKAPVIREPILGGQAQITLGYGNYQNLLKEAEDLSLVLQEGALPAQLVEATKTVVGPSLGADSIRQGTTATLVGAIIIALFMLVYYKWSGFIANAALLFNLLFILAGLAIFQATLTLPGIAGIALTMSMAVDANVLIYERIREELRSGKGPRAAVEAGYSNAMRTIIDANVTTLIAGVVLYQFGTGPIKGFAVTLIMGLLISMYTACVVTRMIYDYMIIKRRVTRISV
ncbi:MAG: protein translocase subunit SecD [Proteobacteria bacterium]|nr:protein translocase subunit SecD [Pseudomonadota bacterium]